MDTFCKHWDDKQDYNSKQLYKPSHNGKNHFINTFHMPSRCIVKNVYNCCQHKNRSALSPLPHSTGRQECCKYTDQPNVFLHDSSSCQLIIMASGKKKI